MPNGSSRVYVFRGNPQGPLNTLLRNWQLVMGVLIFLFIVNIVMSGTGSLLDKIINFLLFIPVLLISLPFHELAHGWMANFLGDPTARLMGRLSLNPMRHLDFVGTIMLFTTGFGWAKPVPIDPANFKDPERAAVSVSLVGPLANIILAFAGGAIIKALTFFPALIHPTDLFSAIPFEFAKLLIGVNLALAAFNLIPIPPLDGSRIVAVLLPRRYRAQYRGLEELDPLLIIIVLMLGLHSGFMRAFTIKGIELITMAFNL